MSKTNLTTRSQEQIICDILHYELADAVYSKNDIEEPEDLPEGMDGVKITMELYFQLCDVVIDFDDEDSQELFQEHKNEVIDRLCQDLNRFNEKDDIVDNYGVHYLVREYIKENGAETFGELMDSKKDCEMYQLYYYMIVEKAFTQFEQIVY